MNNTDIKTVVEIAVGIISILGALLGVIWSVMRIVFSLRKPHLKVAIYPGWGEFQRPVIIFEVANLSKEPVFIDYVAAFWKDPGFWTDNIFVLGNIVFLPGAQCDHDLPFELLPGRNIRCSVSVTELADFLLRKGISGKVKLKAVFRDGRMNKHFSKKCRLNLDEMASGKGPDPIGRK